ncbi:hypothetical protein GALMADRAFT_283600 [Galerina marginata CBS 339.88]|uniref:Uncharacterized protein n=1 Tax=Galerina marginata (strain CBS 339.88) TaxID=685588 RepID=A0A067S8P8_GALM3|nr:hypothetical protein GALMADRAFT_283600 [Galerina marginata CBS 339.88]
MSYSQDQYQYAAVPRPEQQHSYSNNSSTFTQKPEGPSQTLVAAQEHASRKRVVRSTCLIATAILICLIGMIFAFLSFICVFHQCQVSSSSIVSTAPLGRVLTISQITSHVAPLSLPIIMGLFSYLLSVKWLKSSVNGGPDRPSPTQLGLLMSMCNGAGISSLFSTVKYMVKGPKSGQKVTRPPILLQSTVILGSLLAVTYLTAAADSWLHATSTSVVISSSSSFSSPTPPTFGREIDDDQCQKASASGGQQAASCGLLNNGARGTTDGLGEGIRVVSNSSTIHRIVLADDQTAIVVPLSVPPNITYSAKTLGVKSQCRTITKQCMQPMTLPDGTLDYGPDAGLYLNCSKGGISYVNGTKLSPLCPFDSQGVCTFGWEVPSNPIIAGEVVTSTAYVGLGYNYSTFIPNTGWFLHGESGGWNVVYCNITALDVTYNYQSSRYIVQSSTPASVAVTRAIASAAFLDEYTSAVSNAVNGAGLQQGTTYEEAYSLELSRRVIGPSAFIYKPTNVLEIHSQHGVTGSRLELAPLIIFIGTLLVFACQILYIALRIVIATWGVPYVQIASLHLSDPLTTLQRLYGHPDPMLTWETDSDKKFGSETEGDRLRVGPVYLSNDARLGSAFMVTTG